MRTLVEAAAFGDVPGCARRPMCTARPAEGRAVHPPPARRPGRFGRNVDALFTRGRTIARALGRAT